jgi:predicted metal-dependent HD superfamily phosphohydrolase
MHDDALDRGARDDLADWWPLPDGEDLRQQLVEAYDSPTRGYHDVRHLLEVCGRVEELVTGGAPVTDHMAVLLAAWFHDAVYDGRPGA